MTKDNMHKISVLCGIIGDLVLAFYIYIKLTNYEYFKGIMITSLKMQGLSESMISDVMLQEYFGLMANVTLTLVAFFIFVHWIIYFCLYKKFNFARNYMYLYYFTATIGFAALFVTCLFSPSWLIIISLIEVALYGLGVMLLRRSKDEPAIAQ